MTAAARDGRPIRGIAAVRQSLGLGDAEQALVHAAAPRLLPHVAGWVDAFYARLLVDPVAMRILADDARVIRLKRSLTSWFHELCTLPWDAAYERSRERIGEAHNRIHLPTDLMVTAMSGLRGAVVASVRGARPGDVEGDVHLADVLGRALDMELALILLAFRRRERSAARRKDRVVYAERAARRLAWTLHDRLDAALCYLELAEAEEPRRSRWLVRLRDVLRGLARVDQRMRVHVRVNGVPPEHVELGDLCRLALADVTVEPGTTLDYEIEPPGLASWLNVPATRLAIEELAQNGVTYGGEGAVRVRCTPIARGGVCIEVTDEGPGWGTAIHEVPDIYREGSGLGLSFCELVAELHGGRLELFTAPSGGAGVRLELASLRGEEREDA